MRGKFLTFEGGEGCGKSTQVKLLGEHLAALGVEVDVTREPGGTPLAERLRQLLLSGAVRDSGPDAEALIFAAARADHLQRRIVPALKNGTWVICDRFFDSTHVYQSISGADSQTLQALRDEAVGPFIPDLTLILDIDVDVAAQRRQQRDQGGKDRFEMEGASFHRAVRERFLDIALADPTRCVIIDAAQDAEQVAKDIRTVIADRFDLPFPFTPA